MSDTPSTAIEPFSPRSSAGPRDGASTTTRSPSPSASTDLDRADRRRHDPGRWWPPSGPPARSAGSTFTAAPVQRAQGGPAQRLRDGVEGRRSPSTASAVRQTPSTATESPTAVVGAVAGAATTRLRPASPLPTSTTSATSRTIPVNIASRLPARALQPRPPAPSAYPRAAIEEHAVAQALQPPARRGRSASTSSPRHARPSPARTGATNASRRSTRPTAQERRREPSGHPRGGATGRPPPQARRARRRALPLRNSSSSRSERPAPEREPTRQAAHGHVARVEPRSVGAPSPCRRRPASIAARSSCTRRRDASPVTQRRPGTATRPSSDTASFRMTRPPAQRHPPEPRLVLAPRLHPQVERARRPPPPRAAARRRRRLGARVGRARDDPRYARRQDPSTHGGVRRGARTARASRRASPPRGASPAASSATTSACAPPAGSVTPSPTTSPPAETTTAPTVGFASPARGRREGERCSSSPPPPVGRAAPATAGSGSGAETPRSP